ncbi:MAG TPA: O-methyltransferase [Candidatus Dormibacteraeota bacterium]|nr:O-methyltransferase [Candidatus Dormibacteraeota bacterium]
MSERRTPVTPELEAFLAPWWDAPPPVLARIRDDIHARGKYPMQISFEQVALHGWLCRLVGARRILEVGTYFGLSAAGFALAAPDCRVDTVELEAEHAEIARGWLREAGVAERVTVHLGPALEVLPGLAGPYDVCFLDGDKADNPALLELAIGRVRSGGLILVDNAFRDGRVTAAGGEEPTQRVLDLARGDERLDAIVLPVADGILACRRV